MFAQDYYDRCNEETKRFIMIYMDTFSDITNSNNKIDSKYIFIDGRKSECFYATIIFILASIWSGNDLGKIFSKYFNNNIIINSYNEKLLEDLWKKNADFIFSKYTIQKDFFRSNISNSFIIAASPQKGIITLEDIFLNIFNFINPRDFKEIFTSYQVIEDVKNLKVQNEQNYENSKEISQEEPSDSYFKRNTPIKIQNGENLTFKNYSFNPLIGREKDLEKMCALINHKTKSLILYGLPGVGKTALIEGLAYKIQHNQVPNCLANKQIIQISGSEIISGTKYRGMFEERILEIINALKNTEAILFIDEIHTIMGLGKVEDSQNDVANILKPYLGNGSLKIIGATTKEEYEHILEDGAFSRRFNGMEIKPLEDNEILDILKETINRYENTDNIYFDDNLNQEEILKMIIEFTNNNFKNYYLTQELHNPDFALTILENAYAFATLYNEKYLTIDYLIKGIEAIDFISETLKQDFINKIKNYDNKILSRTRVQNKVLSLNNLKKPNN